MADGEEPRLTLERFVRSSSPQLLSHEIDRLQTNKTMYQSKAYSATSKTSPLGSTTIPRRDPTDLDVQIVVHSQVSSYRGGVLQPDD